MALSSSGALLMCFSRQQRALRNHEHTRPRQKTACASVCTCPWPIAACTTRCTACTAPKPLDIILFSSVWRDEGAIFGEFTGKRPGSDQSRTKHACAADQRFRGFGRWRVEYRSESVVGMTKRRSLFWAPPSVRVRHASRGAEAVHVATRRATWTRLPIVQIMSRGERTMSD